jgi:TolB-like protein/Flp pilus assembly protein TadD
MNDPASGLRVFLAELKRRRVFRVAVVYAVVAFVIWQAADFVLPALRLPAWSDTLVVVLTLIGFPIALVLAWAFDVTPEGVRRTQPIAKGESHSRAWLAGAALIVLAVVVAAGWLMLRGGDSAPHRMAVAVLPFANRSGLDEDAYFTDGIHDEILARLSEISGLIVRGRTSVMQYRDSPKNVRQIGEELNARYILEGGVQRAGESVRINLQLVDAESDEHVWAEFYDRPLTIENLLSVQSEVAQQVATALRATLTPAERERVEERPTDNLEAYNLYLRGRSRERRQAGPGPVHEAVAYFERAVELDPEFADAWSRLAIALFDLSGRYGELEARPRAKEALDRARQLAPDAVQTRIAQGYYYYRGYRDWEQAVVHFNAAERLQPSNAEIPLLLGVMLRGQGSWGEAVHNFRRAAELDPLNVDALGALGVSLGMMGQIEQARAHLERAATVDPLDRTLTSRFRHYLHLEGDTAAARAVLEEVLSKQVLSEERSRLLEFELAWFNRDYPRVVELEPRTGRGDQGRLRFAGGDPWLRWALARERTGLLPLAPTYLDSLEARVETEFASLRARAEQLAASDSSMESGIEQNLGWGYSRWHADLAVIRALQGRAEDAIREGKRAVDEAGHAYVVPGFVEELAAVYVRLGRRDEAIDQLEYLLTVPSYLTVASLRIDPTWDPVRDHTRFQALLEDYQ